MALNKEWRNRVLNWQKALWSLCYRPLESVALSGFTTFEQLTAEQALQHAFEPMPEGSAWGAKWEYGWFRGEVRLPEAARGQRIALRLSLGGNSLLWVNGKIAGAYGWAYKEVTLSRSGEPGQSYELLAEAYAGHGPMVETGGPVPFGVENVPEPPARQTKVGECSIGVWREGVYQLALDFTTLLELRDGLDPYCLRVSEIDQGLMDVTLVCDLELPEAEMLESVEKARALLAPLLACTNGPSMPRLHAFGHAHIDVAWLWPLAETERKVARTLANQFSLMAEYPEFRFLQSQPHLYMMLKKRYPELYERVREAVKSGQLIADGAMWVEADTNISGGEALIRQVLHGRRFFREAFGVDSRVLWLPDVFGYSGALPQILKGCGCSGFATQKITWAYNGGDAFPYNIFWWQGIDGSSIPAHIYTDYNSETHPKSIFERWNTRLQPNGVPTLMLAFGHGDGGGGPTRDHLEYLRRERDLEGLPRVEISSPAAFFEDIAARGLPVKRYVGELYFQAHRGTYTSQARTKLGNRRSEIALREAEMWGTAARALRGYAFSARTLDEAWVNLMLNQFHDILPGSSIHRVYEETEAMLGEVYQSAQKAARAAAGSLVAPGEGLTAFNSLSWERTALVETPEGTVEVKVPPCGWIGVTPETTRRGRTGKRGALAGERWLENDLLRAEFNERGELTSLYDKEAGREIMAGAGNAFRLYKDVPNKYDAWDLDSMVEQMPVETPETAAFEVVKSSPLVAKLRLTRKLAHSSLTQVVSLRRGSRRIDFETTVDWQESHRCLKVAFPVQIHADEAIHEIQFGHLRRPTHRSRPYDADRFEVCNHKWSALAEENRGVALLNDCKYGLSATGNSLNLTLLKSSLAPDMTADKGLQHFTYALYVWNGSLAESGVVREAYELNVPVLVAPGEGGMGSLFSLDAENIVIETVKPAEDSPADVIVRLYEAKRMATRCVLSTSLKVKGAQQTDMTEVQQAGLACKDGKIALDFRPFEIKTVRLKL